MARSMSAEVVPLPLKEPSLNPILSLTAHAMNAVNAIILDRMQSEIPLIPALAAGVSSRGATTLSSPSGMVTSIPIPPNSPRVCTCISRKSFAFM